MAEADPNQGLSSSMESKRKVMDRISQLPDRLLHHILSFLNIQSIAQSCILSKRWRNVWTYIPILNFDHSSYELLTPIPNSKSLREHDDAKEESFYQFVLGVLKTRRHEVWNLKKMIIYYNPPIDIDETIFKLLFYFALSHHVEELSINARHLSYVDWSCCISTCQLLRLTGQYKGIWLPLRLDFLKSLEIVSDHASSLNIEGEMFTSCSNLESLVLRGHVYKHARISAPRLEYLEIGYGFANHRLQETTLIAPKLTHVKFDNFLPNLMCVVNLPCLCKVELTLKQDYLIPSHSDQAMKQQIEEKLKGLFDVLRNATSLTLSLIAAEALSFFRSSSDEILEGDLNHKLRKLKLKINKDKWTMPDYIMKYLLKSPAFKTFDVELS